MNLPLAVAGGGPHPRDGRKRSELVLAMARVWLALSVLGVLFADRPTPGIPFSIVAIAAYGAFAVVVLLAVRRAETGRRLLLTSHAGDVITAAGLLALSDAGMMSAMIVGFALVSAALRWGVVGAAATGGATAILQLAPTDVVPLFAGSADAGVVDSTGIADQLLARAAYLVIAGVVVGYVVQSREDHVEDSLVADVIGRLDVRLGLTAAIRVALDALLHLFGARRAILVASDRDTGYVSMWDAQTAADDGERPSLQQTRLEGAAVQTYLSVPPAAAFHVVRSGAAQLEAVWVGLEPGSSPPALPEALLAAVGPFDQMIAAGTEVPKEWTARVFLIDPAVTRDQRSAVALLQRVIARLVVPLHNVYLLRRVRARSVVDERARIGRELHDGVVQSMLGVQVQLHALALQASDVRRELAVDINRLALTLREEVLRLRDLMQEMKPIAPEPEQLMNTIAGVVRRFETETCIRTRLVTGVDRVPLLPPACLELLRIVQEALVNVRRHSGAANVVIRFTVDAAVCRLTVDDDGRGFPFTGRLSLADMERLHQGPWVIIDRVRRLGGEIAVESAPGHGSRLEIAIPVSTYALHG